MCMADDVDYYLSGNLSCGYLYYVARVNIIRIITASGRRESMHGEFGLLSNVLVSTCIILSLNDALAPFLSSHTYPTYSNGNPGE